MDYFLLDARLLLSLLAVDETDEIEDTDDFDFLDDATWTKLKELAALDDTTRHNVVSFTIQQRHREMVACGRIGQDGKRTSNRVPGGAARVRW